MVTKCRGLVLGLNKNVGKYSDSAQSRVFACCIRVSSYYVNEACNNQLCKRNASN